MTPEGLRYTKDHEWARLEGDTVTVGITHYAQDQLGDIVFLELPALGRTLEAGQSLGVIEAVKTTSDIFAPAGGEVVAVNQALVDTPEKKGQPELVNHSPYEEGWMVKLRVRNPAELEALLDARGYAELLEGLHA